MIAPSTVRFLIVPALLSSLNSALPARPLTVWPWPSKVPANEPMLVQVIPPRLTSAPSFTVVPLKLTAPVTPSAVPFVRRARPASCALSLMVNSLSVVLYQLTS